MFCSNQRGEWQLSNRKLGLLVGDNPFHGISHLSQARARSRSKLASVSEIDQAAKLVETCVDNGASGFTFSVSDTTLSIIKSFNQDKMLDLYPLLPYAFEYVRLATKTGGFSGLAKQVIRQILFSSNGKAIAPAIVGGITTNPSKLMETYLIYELSRVKHAGGKNTCIKSAILHEVVTDMALALNLDWLFDSYINFMVKSKIRPGIHTRNLPYLLKKFSEWEIDTSQLTLLTPFNKIGFAMNPSKEAYEESLDSLPYGTQVIAMSILASGYLTPAEAIDYVSGFSKVTDLAVGVSSEQQAQETFRLLCKQTRPVANVQTDQYLENFDFIKIRSRN